MHYNAHNARLFHDLAATGWQALSAAEQRGVEQWTQNPTEVPLVLEVADQLFAADAFARAEVHYAAARRQAPFTLRGDLWAAVRWAWTLQLQREEFTPTHRRELQLALVRADFLAQGKSASQSTPILNYIRGQLHYFLQQHEQALPYLEAAFHVEAFRRQFMDTLFPVLAAELFYAGRADEARRLARLVSDEEGGNPTISNSSKFSPAMAPRLLLHRNLSQGGKHGTAPHFLSRQQGRHTRFFSAV